MIDENSTDRFSWQFWPLAIRYRCGFDIHNYIFEPNTHGGWRHRSHSRSGSEVLAPAANGRPEPLYSGALFVMGPHADDLDRLFIFDDLVDQSMLDVDPP